MGKHYLWCDIDMDTALFLLSLMGLHVLKLEEITEEAGTKR